MNISASDRENYRNSLQTLYDALRKAYWAASTIEAKDAITDLSQSVFDSLTILDQEALDSDTTQYKALKATVVAMDAKLRLVRSRTNNWIRAVSVASQLTATIDETIGLAAKFIR